MINTIVQPLKTKQGWIIRLQDETGLTIKKWEFKLEEKEIAQSKYNQLTDDEQKGNIEELHSDLTDE